MGGLLLSSVNHGSNGIEVILLSNMLHGSLLFILEISESINYHETANDQTSLLQGVDLLLSLHSLLEGLQALQD